MEVNKMNESEMNEENCGCDTENVDFYDMMERRLVGMSFWAHKQILFDKIKQRIENEEGKKLDKLADLVVEISKSEWKSDKEIGKKHKELTEKLRKEFKETFEG